MESLLLEFTVVEIIPGAIRALDVALNTIDKTGAEEVK
jgi:hypothetical protein